jgi:hypothetical protein
MAITQRNPNRLNAELAQPPGCPSDPLEIASW